MRRGPGAPLETRRPNGTPLVVDPPHGVGLEASSRIPMTCARYRRLTHPPYVDLDAIAAELNERPRQTLGWMTPSEAWLEQNVGACRSAILAVGRLSHKPGVLMASDRQ